MKADCCHICREPVAPADHTFGSSHAACVERVLTNCGEPAFVYGMHTKQDAISTVAN